MNNLIPVVFTPDKNYIIPTAIAIISMLETKDKSTGYHFYIVISNKLTDNDLYYIYRISDLFKEFKFEIIKINGDIFDNQIMNIAHITSSTYYRLILSDLLQDNKVMYHDGDVLILSDLKDMFEINMENYYVAGIKAALDSNHNITKYLESQTIHDFENYIVAGNLIFNLNYIRVHKLRNTFIEHMEKSYPMQDQDVINICCRFNINYLPLKYGFMNRWKNSNVLQTINQRSYSLEEIEEGIKNVAVIHFAGAEVKPWVNLRAVGSELWWNYAVQLLNEDDYLKWYNNADIHTRKRDYEYLFTELKKNDKIYIFGFGVFGKTLCELLLRNGYNVLGFIDNDKKKNGSKIYGVEVYSLNQVNSENVIFINTVINYEKEIKEQLLCNGVLEKNIVRFINKTAIYYQALDEKYYEYELNDILKYEYPDKCYENALLLFKKQKDIMNKYHTQYWIENANWFKEYE